jgi:hypothetical protein
MEHVQINEHALYYQQLQLLQLLLPPANGGAFRVPVGVGVGRAEAVEAAAQCPVERERGTPGPRPQPPSTQSPGSSRHPAFSISSSRGVRLLPTANGPAVLGRVLEVHLHSLVARSRSPRPPPQRRQHAYAPAVWWLTGVVYVSPSVFGCTFQLAPRLPSLQCALPGFS